LPEAPQSYSRLPASRRLPPIWLMGLTNSTFGMYGGLVSISLPALLAEQHLPEARIAAVTAACISPAFWIFIVCPMLDVRFTRRAYAAASAAGAGIFAAAGLMNLHHTSSLEVLLLLGFACACITQNALGGWLSTVIHAEQESRLSSWFNVANVAAGGFIAMVASEMLHGLPLPLAASLLGLMLILPIAIYPFIPVNRPDGRLARESFIEFFRDVLRLLKRREVLIALALFLLPSGSFALTNVIGGLGGDFHASARVIALSGGIGVILAGIVGSLVFPLLARHMALRPLYLCIGVVGALFTLSLLLLPHTPAVFALAFTGEILFQALAITGTFAIAFETIGQHNPLAATTFSVLGAACNLPIVYMELVDGRGYAWHGVAGSFIADAALGLLACALLALVLRRFGRGSGIAQQAASPKVAV
jgi:PAT family beta-lactamase induction signal transducer AmpG